VAGPATWRPLIAAGIGTVGGVEASLPYPPDGLPEPLPLAYLGEARSPVVMGAREKHRWTVPLTLVVARKAEYGRELAAVEAFDALVMAWFRANITLGGAVLTVSVTEIREGVVSLAQTDHVGVTWTLLVHEIASTNLSG
jgi:hypothetical protein